LQRLAEASASHLLMERALTGFDVHNLMRTRFERVPATLPLDQFIEDYLLRSTQVLWPVTEGDRDIGFVSALDLPLLDPEKNAGERSVRDCMHTLAPEACLAPSVDAQSALRVLAMQTAPAPVVDGGRVVGIIHQADILRWLSFH
jgi:predicted transcriptional regulator